MVDPPGREAGKICFFLSLTLRLLWRLQFQILRLCRIKITDSFRFIEKDNRSIYFTKTDLTGIFHFFRRPAKTVLLTKDHLFHQKLHFFIRCVKLFT